MASTTSVNVRLHQIAEYAVKVSAVKFGQPLDYSENSLHRLEVLLQQAYQRNSSQVIPEEAVQKTSRVWGSYLGELIRRKWGGEWVVSGQDVKLTINGKTYSPIQQVYQRITLGQQYDIKKYIADIASDISGETKFVQQRSALPILTSIKSVGSNLIQSISNFWKSGRTGKIATVVPLLLILCCCCIFMTRFTSTLNRAAPSTIITKLPDIGKPASTFTTAPISINPLVPTASFTPSLAPSPTATEILTSPLPSEKPLRIHFIDVGQGDSILIQTPNGQTMLIDGGDTDTGIVQYLQSLGVQRIDLMVATHPHSDHIGGLVQVLKAFPAAKVVTNGELYTTSVYEHFLDAIITSKAEYIDLKRGDVLLLDGIDFHCLSPVAPTNSDTNENSIVLQFTYDQITFLLMGDSGADTESALLASDLLSKVNILKVGHHGSASGSTPAFLNVIKPDIAIYSAGLNNMYGNPAPQTIAALIAAGAKVYGTDQNGTVIITADLNGYRFNPAKRTDSITLPVLPTATPIPTLPLTPTPTMAFTPALTPALTPSVPAPGQLEIKSVTSPVSRNQSATLVAQTSPNVYCSIAVHYKTTISKASGLESKDSNASGMVTWTWTVGPSTSLGIWPIDVTCNGVTQSTTFTVR